jgi:hypothetical protein
MAQNAVELLKRAFASFAPIAKRDPNIPGAVEVDLGKVAIEIAKAAAELGATGDVDALEKSLDEFGVLLEKSTYDVTTDKVYSPATDIAKRVAVTKEDGRYYVDHGSGAAKPPAKGSKEQKDQQYTAEGGLATDKGPQYTQTATASVATTPGGAPAIGFDQPAGGPQATKKAAAGPAAKPTRTNEGAAQAEGETAAEPAISEGKQGRRAKRVAKAAGGPVTTEELWARDMAAMTTDEVAEVRKAAKAQAAGAGPEAEVDEVDNEKSTKKAAKKPGFKSHDAGPAEGAEVDEIKAKKAAQAAGAGPEAEVDEVEGGGDTDDRSAADAKRKTAKAKKKAGGAEGGYAAGADDVDTVKAGKKPFADEADDEDEDAEDDGDDEEAEGEGDEKPFPPKKPGKTAKRAEGDDEWPLDLSPANSPVGKGARLTTGEVAAKASGAKAVAKRHAEIRKAALEDREPEEIPGDELSPDQVAELRKRAALTPAQQRRANARRLKQAGYVPGSRELEISGVEEAAVASEE